MRTNLIQSYTNNLSQPQSKKKDLDIEYVLSNRTFIKPLPAKGKLLKSSLLDVPNNTAKDIAYDFKSLKHALKGESNDHELGKINDLGMKVGGLAIAIYLITRKQTPLAKAMEIVGLTSFFAAMKIWPKLALQLPAKLIHGFDIRQEYEDSFGRKKMFFQDPQYIPWDLMSDEEINKIGDRMKVPKDMQNRRDFIQEKMKKTAVQNNTLWMLTAGFATPITSALICNVCEKPLKHFLGNMRNKKADNLLANAEQKYTSYKDISALQELEELCKTHKDRPINKVVTDKIKACLTKNMDEVTSTAIKADIDNMFAGSNKKFVVDKNVVENTITRINSVIERFAVNAKITDIKSFEEVLSNAGFLDKELTEIDIKKVMHLLGKETKKSLNQKNLSPEVINQIISEIVQNETVSNTIHSKSATLLNDSVIQNLRGIGKTLTNFKAKNALLDDYVHIKYAAAPETVIANSFNDVTESLLKTFKFTDKEISTVRYDRKLAGKLLREKFENITQNEAEYKRVITELTEKIAKLETKLGVLESGKAKGSYADIVDSVFEQTARSLKFSMPQTAERLIGSNNNVEGSLKNIQLSFVKDRLLGVKSSLYRLLNTLDFYKRISSLENIPALHSKMPREVKEEIVEFAKNLSLGGSTSDFMTKFFELRNPHPDMTDFSQIEVKAGKVVNKYLSKVVKGGKAELPNDANFFKEIMKLLYENEMHPQTKEILSSTVVEKGVSRYRREFLSEVGNTPYFAKPHHVMSDIEKRISTYANFLRTGMAPDKMFHSVIKETFNTRKWLKIFGGFGAALLGVTVLAQFFFGKMKADKGAKND